MNLIQFYLSHAPSSKFKIVLISLISGVSNVFLLSLANNAAEHASQNHFQLLTATLYLLTVLIYFLSQQFLWTTVNQLAQDIQYKIRKNVFTKLARHDFESLEQLGKGYIYNTLTQHGTTITVSTIPVFHAIQGFILVFFILGYLAYLSVLAFTITLVFIGLVVLFALLRSDVANSRLDNAIIKEQEFFHSLEDILEGFKEIKLNSNKQGDLLRMADNVAKGARELRVQANMELTTLAVISQTALYLLLAILVFFLPQLSLGTGYQDTIIKVVTAGLLLFPPVTSIIMLMPTFSNTQISINHLLALETSLDEHASDNISEHLDIEEFIPFDGLSLTGIRHSYRKNSPANTAGTGGNGNGFSIGPINVDIRPNRIIFITGGNGSGKSTLMKVLSGLYQPTQGEITINGNTVDSDNIIAYRNIFAGVFSDFRLFSHNYGLSHIDNDKMKVLLDKMGLKGKTSLVDGQFSTTSLSTGQMKRLALVISILEERPVMIFDEWAADQDPTFRKTFYHDIIPELKTQGKTVIAITHDEKYFDCADQHFHMSDGLLEEVIKQ
ncbi:MAG: cyclic peptide export ABC transporter [Gammaproteobacteria bacterium]|nr:cyclic peptide export ABC transporter [Gammaproteobacteria bacterium]DAC82003.1 TPA_exp: transporter [uncultured Gammaproteobacteria bacterium]